MPRNHKLVNIIKNAMSIGRMTGKEMERKQFKNVKLSISWLPCKILNISTNCYCK